MSESRLFAVAGRPVLHSLSPEIHRAGFAKAGIDAHYTRLAVNDAAEIFALAAGLGLTGLNITAPFKEAVIPFLDVLDETARRIGAVNTIVREDGRWIGHNTDPAGVAGALAAHRIDPRGKRILVLGAGGAGRAAADALVRSGGRVTIVNRTGDRAARASLNLGCDWTDWGERGRAVRAADLAVSCLADPRLALDPGLLRPGQVLLDASYRASTTAGRARSRGATVIRGESWLLHQACAAFELFTGVSAPYGAMARKLARARSRPPKPCLALIGFMGAGKSAIARIVAARTGGSPADTDALIEAGTGLSVPDLFAREGEEGFRALECGLVRSLPFEKGGVYALGGGTVLDRANRRSLRRKAVTFWIYADPVEAAARVEPGSRPLLEGTDAARRALELFRERRGLYAEAADAVVLNDGANGPGAAAERIIDEMHHLIAD